MQYFCDNHTPKVSSKSRILKGFSFIHEVFLSHLYFLYYTQYLCGNPTPEVFYVCFTLIFFSACFNDFWYMLFDDTLFSFELLFFILFSALLEDYLFFPTVYTFLYSDKNLNLFLSFNSFRHNISFLLLYFGNLICLVRIITCIFCFPLLSLYS